MTALGDQAVRHDDEKARAAERRIRSTILEIFGERSPEYRDHQYHDISGGMSIVVGGFGDEPDAHESELQENFVAGIRRTVTMLGSLIDTIKERTDHAVDSVGRARVTFEGLDLHPRIAQVCTDLYRDGHYRNAVLDAGIALMNFVKEKSRRHDLDGANLMRTVFSRNDPILAFNDLRDQAEQDEQEGMMHLFEGAALALRNPRAHALSDDSPEMALDYLMMLSMLAKRLDRDARRK